MRRKLLMFVCAVMMALSLVGIAACDNGTETGGGTNNPPEPPPSTPVYTLTLTGETQRALKIDDRETIVYTVKKDGVKVSDQTVTMTVTGDAVTCDAATGAVTAVKEGESKLTLALSGHAEVEKVEIVYTVTDYFFNRTIRRGDLNMQNEDNGSVAILGGDATLVAKSAATAFVFSGKVEIAAFAKSDAFGIGSFVDEGNHALWLGLKNEKGTAENNYSVYVRDFYNGWGSATADKTLKGYQNLNFGTDLIDFTLVRNETVYYYNIGGYVGKYLSTYTEATYPGFFSQQLPMTITDFAVSYAQSDVDAKIATYAASNICGIAINETDKFQQVRGTSFSFTATKMPDYTTEAVTWSVDKTNVLPLDESVADERDVTVDSNGKVTIGANTKGTFVLKCSSVSNAAASQMTVTILEKSQNAENDQLSVKGGVILNSDGSVTFPKTMSKVDGIGNERDYEDRDYGVTLKQKVIGDFSLSFTVVNWVIESFDANNNKLLISLGGQHNQFYITRSKSPSKLYLETFTNTFTNGQYWNGGDWTGSDSFNAGEFYGDGVNEHTYTIEVIEGVYKITMDGEVLETGWFNGDTRDTRDNIRRYADYRQQLPIRFGTKGVSCTIKDIVLTGGTEDTAAKTAFRGYKNISDVTNDGFKGTFAPSGWEAFGVERNIVYVTQTLPENFELDYTIAFDAAMKDAKLIAKFGSLELHIENKLGADNGKMEATSHPLNNDTSDHNWGGNITKTVTDSDNPLSVVVKIIRNAGKYTFTVNGIAFEERAPGTTTAISQMSFYLFNEKGEEGNLGVTVSGFNLRTYTPPVQA